MGLFYRAREWNFDIDHYLNRIVPPSPLHKLPAPVSRYLGYRKVQEQDVGNILGAFWSCVGAFLGLAVIAAVFNHSESIQRHHPPALIASFVCTSSSNSIFYSLLTTAHIKGRVCSPRIQLHSFATRTATECLPRPHSFRTRWCSNYKALSIEL